MIRVYRYGLRPPKLGADIVRDQLDAARTYANDLVAIERGRRSAMRALHDTEEVRAAAEAIAQTTKSDRVQALRALGAARLLAEQETRCAGGHWSPSAQELARYGRAPHSALYELERIEVLESRAIRDARELTSCFWGTYLDIETAARQARKAPLYDDDGVTPSDPRFRRRRQDGLREGQLGIQIQSTKPMVGSLLLDGQDTRVRIVESGGHHTLSLRIGSSGREPVWAAWDMRSMRHRNRAIPDDARVLWVRVSCRVEADREHWTCEITLDLPWSDKRALDRSLDGAIAVELGWWPQDDGSMVVATWLDSSGQRGVELLSARDVEAVRHPDGILSVRDVGRNDLRERLSRALVESKEDLPRWLRDAANTMHLWKSKDRFHALREQWSESGWDGCADSRALLEAWHHRDRHLHQYEDGERGQSIRRRDDGYRCLASRWAKQYRTVLLPDRDLSREARFGEDADRRFTASPQSLRSALRGAFGADARDVLWRGPHGVEDSEAEDAPTWLESAIEQWRDGKFAERARKKRKSTDHLEKGGSWGAKKSRKAAGTSRRGAGAREPNGKAAE